MSKFFTALHSQAPFPPHLFPEDNQAQARARQHQVGFLLPSCVPARTVSWELQYCERRIINNGKNQTRFLSEDCSLPEADTSTHSDNSEQSAQDLTGPGPESIAPNVQSLPEGKTECITGGSHPQSPSRSSYRAPQGATRKAQVDGFASPRAGRAGQQQGRTQPARCGHPLRGEMNPFLEALMKKQLLTTNST